MHLRFDLPWKPVGSFWLAAVLLNACLMTVEITAGRLLAPFVGVSVIVWASIIGVVMVAMALGYGLGAWASRRSVPHLSFFVCVLGAALTVGTARLMVGLSSRLALVLDGSLPVEALLLATSALFLPAFFLAATHPLLVRMATPDEERAGRAVGMLNMGAALGSIVGTFVTGFVWLMWFSIPTILSVTANLLFVTGVLGVLFFRRRVVSFSLSAAQTVTRPRVSLFFCVVASFLSGCAFMAVEIAAGRALAPSLGTSVFTWTGVIGTILLGTTLGNVVGGVLADREGSPTLLGKTFVWSGVAVLVALYVAAMAGSWFSGIGMPLVLRVFLLALIAFLPSAFAMGMISPQLARLVLLTMREVGSTVGVLTAANTLGGLLGALGSGFFFISWLGTRGLFLSIAMLLLLVGLALLPRGQVKFGRSSVLVALLFLLPLAFPRTCDRETQYYCIQVLKDVAYTPSSPAYVLRLDHLVHSYVRLEHPEALGYGYEQVYAHLLNAYETSSSTFSALFIGGGGYVLPRYIESTYPFARSVVAEIDPEVTEVNYARLGLARTTKIETRSLDARMYLAREAQGESFDFVFGDAFNDFSVPYHLTTVEFHQLLKSRMNPQGVYALNIIDDPRYGKFLSSMVRTLREVWAHVYVAPGAATFRAGRNTIVLLASDRSLDAVTWRGGMSWAAKQTGMEQEEYVRLTQLMSQDKVEAFLAGHAAPALTDAFLPTDRYLAPVFSDAY